MKHEAAAYLEDIRLAVEDALELAEGIDEGACLTNKQVRLAVERVLIPAGEALSQLAKFSPDTAEKIPDWRKIIGFRTMIVHGYRTLDHPLIYSVIREKLPDPRDSVAVLLAELDQA
ncbi:MAG: DUF86 domain-containing protein [Amphiplicatus sp.]